MHAADEKMKDELKIIGWIQFMRTADHALKQLFTKVQWAKIEKAAKMRKVSLEDDSDEAAEAAGYYEKSFSNLEIEDVYVTNSNIVRQSCTANSGLVARHEAENCDTRIAATQPSAL